MAQSPTTAIKILACVEFEQYEIKDSQTQFVF